MTDDKIASLVAHFTPSVPEESLLTLRDALKTAQDTAYSRIMATPLKSVTTTVLLSVFLGGLGIDRFYIGDVGTGVAKLLLGWLTFGIWPLVDIFCCYKKAKKVNLQKILASIAGN